VHARVAPGSTGLRALRKLATADLPLWQSGAEPCGDAGAPQAALRADDVLAVPRAPQAPQTATHMAVLDLEATCDERRGFAPMEVIELPVVLVELATGRVIDEFRSFVRPTVHPVLTEFCRELTGITQAQVDAAPEFPEALAAMLAWLASHGFGPEGAGAGNRSVVFVCDGDWDLRSMMPKQCVLSGVEMPPLLHRWVDVRQVFAACLNTHTPGLLKMCQALGVRFVGQAHSGIADARNIARVALTLLQDYPAVLAPTSQIKGLEALEQSEEVVPVAGLHGASNGQASFEARREQTVCARMALLAATEPDEKALEAALRNMKLSRDEVKRVLHHARLLGHIPDPANAGELRRYRAVLGDEVHHAPAPAPAAVGPPARGCGGRARGRAPPSS